VAARVVLASAVVLVASSAAPLFLGMGAIYAVAAAVGGAYFLRAAWRLAREPSRVAAIASFRASLVQLTLLLAGAIVDRAA
jgi:protoheme IX farnesyltransferase